MKCQTVRTRLPGYLDDVVTGAARVEERTVIREHLEGCNVCRAELEKFRKLSVLLSRVPKNDPPAAVAYGAPVHIFGPDEIVGLIAAADAAGFDLDGTFAPEHSQRPVRWKRYGLNYTFVRLTFVRRGPS